MNHSVSCFKIPRIYGIGQEHSYRERERERVEVEREEIKLPWSDGSSLEKEGISGSGFGGGFFGMGGGAIASTIALLALTGACLSIIAC